MFRSLEMDEKSQEINILFVNDDPYDYNGVVKFIEATIGKY